MTTALCHQMISLIVSVIVIFVSWAFLRYADIPVTAYWKDISDEMNSND